ncbi:YdiU family protein [Cohnella sp. REN36]|uniref:protein adenylyltransferase SelO n=1 Tax=Cohnella sp. REN36 TaxID=2887347 RepID=UPI001D15E25E|nr:YdiU family protein [Cohnella sp. REN36]MCC3375333.1 YdiU family protein [Cohnella sp. REN36]
MTENKAMTDAGWKFDNSYARLPQSFSTRVDPTPVRSPSLAVLNGPLAEALGLNAEALRGEEGIAALAGNRAPSGAEPIAQAYAGHQFGHFTMLGDGRAILLGEQIAPSGARFDIQLKGSGRTPYSRGGDGRAALGPMLREYIISEAMHGLGIPTTRSLAVVATGEPVYRETELPGAILTRVAASHLRIGTFQYVSAWQGAEALRTLADYALARHDPDAAAEDDRYLALFRRVIARQAELIARWQLVGFVHGVMNTDNMSIAGETIDYGPCAFLDVYDPATVFSSIDAHGRYAYGNQPHIGGWNLARLAEAMLPLFDPDEERAIGLAEEALSAYSELYRGHWLSGMRAKLGLLGEEADDETLIAELLELMQRHRADYTNTFVALSSEVPAGIGLFSTTDFARWQASWEERLARQSASREDVRRAMRARNPSVIPRNHRVEEALRAAVEEDDYGVMHRLLGVLAVPYAYSPEQAEYAAPPPSSDRPYRTFCGT